MDLRKMLLDHIESSHKALATADKALRKQAEVEKQVESLIPKVVEALVAHERIAPAQRQKAAALLRNPVQALRILLKTADINNVLRSGRLGSPVKTASAGVSTPPSYIGYRFNKESEADRAFRQALLGR